MRQVRLNDLKVGDKIYIRDDLTSEYDRARRGEQRIAHIYDLHRFCVKGSTYIYSSNLVDWEKTTALNKATINNIKPNHYKLNIKGIDLEVKDIMQEVMEEEQYKGFLYGNAIKYILRAYKKNGVEDLEKARKYIGWLIEQEDNNYGH